MILKPKFLAFCLINSLVFGQSSIKKLDYTVNKEYVNAYGFTIARCNMDAVNNTWQDWIKAKGGKVTFLNNILGKKEANEVIFNNSNSIYTVFLEKVELTDSIQIVNIFKDENGLYLNDSSSDYDEILDRLKDLSFEIRKACIRLEIDQANEYQNKLYKELVDLQQKKGKLNRDILSNQNKLLKSESKLNNITEQLGNLNKKIDMTDDSGRLEKYMKRKTKVEEKYYSYKEKIESLNTQIKNDQLSEQQLIESITGVEAKQDDQSRLLLNLKENFNQIYR